MLAHAIMDYLGKPKYKAKRQNFLYQFEAGLWLLSEECQACCDLLGVPYEFVLELATGERGTSEEVLQRVKDLRLQNP